MRTKVFSFALIFSFGVAFSHPHFNAQDMEYFQKYISGEFAKRGLDTPNANQLNFNKNLVKMVFVLVLLYIFYQIFAPRFFKNRFDSKQSEHMKVLDVTSIGFQKSLKLVQVGKDFLLLSVSPLQVLLICKVEDPEIIDALKLEVSFQKGDVLEKSSFLNWWTKKKSWKNNKILYNPEFSKESVNS